MDNLLQCQVHPCIAVDKMSVERLAVLELDQHWVALGGIEEAERQLREGTLVSKNPAMERGSSFCCCTIAAGGQQLCRITIPLPIGSCYICEKGTITEDQAQWIVGGVVAGRSNWSFRRRWGHLQGVLMVGWARQVPDRPRQLHCPACCLRKLSANYLEPDASSSPYSCWTFFSRKQCIVAEKIERMQRGKDEDKNEAQRGNIRRPMGLPLSIL